MTDEEEDELDEEEEDELDEEEEEELDEDDEEEDEEEVEPMVPEIVTDESVAPSPVPPVQIVTGSLRVLSELTNAKVIATSPDESWAPGRTKRE